LHLIESRSRSLGPTINSREISITPPLASSPRPSTLAAAAFARNALAFFGPSWSAFRRLPSFRLSPWQRAPLDAHCRSRRDYRRHRQVRREAGRACPLNASGHSKSDGPVSEGAGPPRPGSERHRSEGCRAEAIIHSLAHRLA
jgi:hypothetical protein